MNTKKQRITVICLVLAAALLCFQTASAGSMNAGDSFDTATLIEPGFYEDEITEKEEKYSYIEIKPGQQFIFKTTFDESDLRGSSRLNVEIFDMDRSKIRTNVISQGCSKSFYYSTSSKKKSYKFYTKIDLDINEASNAKYHTSVSIKDHFDANSETDAGDTFNDALSISPGNCEGYLSTNKESGNDLVDHYKLSIQSGDKVTVALTPSEEVHLCLSVYNENRECVKTEDSKDAGSIAKTQWIADSSQDIYIQVKGLEKTPDIKHGGMQSHDFYGGDYSLDITTGKASKKDRQIPSESDPESESESEEQPGFESLIALISLVGVYIGFRKKIRKNR